jgi:hypothetical protein
MENGNYYGHGENTVEKDDFWVWIGLGWGFLGD